MEFSSSNKYAEDLLNWAKQKAGTFVMTGKTDMPVNKGDGGKWYGPSRFFFQRSHVIKKPNQSWAQPKDCMPCYWAGYHDRTAFYIRDFVHQAPGAEYLGFHEENCQMLRCFAEGAAEEIGWYAPWAFNFDGSVYYMDTPNHKRFVRILAAQYELVETIGKLYFLSGDRRCLDRRMLEFCKRILNELTEEHISEKTPGRPAIPCGRGNIWLGSAGYNESGKGMAESGDSIGALYRALLAYGGLCEATGSSAEAKDCFQRAEELKSYFNRVWSVPPEGDGYVFGVDLKGRKHMRWVKSSKGINGAESCFFIPMKLLTEPGAQNDGLLDYIDEMADGIETGMPNIESYTYLPQVFFPYHRAERAWYWMKYIGDRRFLPHVHKSQGLNEDYPELSFTMVSCAVEGLFGVHVNVPSCRIETCPCLPKEIPDLAVRSLRAGEYTLDIRCADNTAELVNRSEKPIVWKCAFAGEYSGITVCGEAVPTQNETVNGVEHIFCECTVQPGGSADAAAVR